MLYPTILALYPPIALFSANLGQVGIEKLLFPLLFAVVISAAIWLIFFLVVRNLGKSSLLTAIFQVAFFSYGHVYSLIEGFSIGGFIAGRHRFLAIIWILATFLLLLITFRSKQVTFGLHQFVTIFALAALILPAGQILISLVDSEKAVVDKSGESTTDYELAAGYKPDIYYIILDTYTRSDILQNEYDYDNSDFIDSLTIGQLL